jgi:hypothetical protein
MDPDCSKSRIASKLARRRRPRKVGRFGGHSDSAHAHRFAQNHGKIQPPMDTNEDQRDCDQDAGGAGSLSATLPISAGRPLGSRPQAFRRLKCRATAAPESITPHHRCTFVFIRRSSCITELARAFSSRLSRIGPQFARSGLNRFARPRICSKPHDPDEKIVSGMRAGRNPEASIYE